MKFELKQNLGLDDVNFCNKEFHASLSTDPKDLVAGQIVDLPEKAVKWLTENRRLTALLQPANIRGEAKKPEITAPAK